MSITIPNFPLPFDIPSMMHPLFVHFAIALPVILLILEIINLIAKRRILTGINIFFAILIPLIYFATYLTGIEDAKNLNIEALEAHKQLGVYMVYGSLIVLLFKLISSAISKIQIKIFFYLALVAFIATSFIEGKRGGELVYKYGANVKAQNSTNSTKAQKPSGNEAKVEQNSTTTEEAKPKEQESNSSKAAKDKQEQNSTKNEQNATAIENTKPQKQNETAKIESKEQNSTTAEEAKPKEQEDSSSKTQADKQEQNKTLQNNQPQESNSTLEYNKTKHNIANELNNTVANSHNL
jgi:uncharacterized membrane protein